MTIESGRMWLYKMTLFWSSLCQFSSLSLCKSSHKNTQNQGLLYMSPLKHHVKKGLKKPQQKNQALFGVIFFLHRQLGLLLAPIVGRRENASRTTTGLCQLDLCWVVNPGVFLPMAKMCAENSMEAFVITWESGRPQEANMFVLLNLQPPVALHMHFLSLCKQSLTLFWYYTYSVYVNYVTNYSVSICMYEVGNQLIDNILHHFKCCPIILVACSRSL